MRNSFSQIALAALAFVCLMPAIAFADPAIGSACSPDGVITQTGGAETSGVGAQMVCVGSVWVSTVGYDGSGNASVTNAFSLRGDITSASLGASQNDYAPTGLATASVIRLTTSTPINITGLTGGADGRTLTLMNIGANTITLVNQSASSTAANRFLFGKNILLGADQTVSIIYDTTSQRWRAAGIPFDSAAACLVQIPVFSDTAAPCCGYPLSTWTDGTYVYVGDNDGEISALSFNPTTRVWTSITTLSTGGGGPGNLAGRGSSYIYMAKDTLGIRAFSFNGSTITQLASSTAATNANKIWDDGTYVYVADGAGGVRGFSFNGSAFTLGGTYNTSTNAVSVWHDGTYLYVGTNDGWLRAFTFSGTVFTLRGSIRATTSGLIEGITGDGAYQYLAIWGDSAKTLQAYSFNGTTFTARGSLWHAGPNGGILAKDGLLYFAYTGGIIVYSFDGTNFVFKGSFPVPGVYSGSTISADTNDLYVGSSDSGVSAHLLCK